MINHKNIIDVKSYYTILLVLIMMFSKYQIVAQNMGIGTSTPNASAKLDITATDKGLLIPRVALTATNAASPITSPSNSLLVYNTAKASSGSTLVTPGYYYWNSSSWVRLLNSKTLNANNGLTIAGDTLIQLGGALIQATTITQGHNAFTIANNGTANTVVNLSSSGDFDIQDNGTSAFYVGDTANVGIGTSTPGQKLEVYGNISMPGSVGNYALYTWASGDANWRIGMHNSNANVGFSRSLATSHVQYASFSNGSGQGFAVGDKLTGLSSFEVTGSGSSYNAFFRGSVGIGVNPSHKLTIAGTGNVFGVDNTASFAAKNASSNYETYFWPRWSDNVMYMNFGSAGLNLRNNSATTALLIDNDLSIDIKKGVLFNCDDCGATNTIDGSGNYGDLVIQGRVLSTNSNLHLSPPNGFRVIINTTYRAAGGSTGTSGLEIQDGGIRMRKNYLHYQSYRYCNCYGAGSSGPLSLGTWDFCGLSQVGFKNNQSTSDEDDDVQCAVYPSNSGYGEQNSYNNSYTHAFNARPTWYMYLEAFSDTNGITCAANCINFD